MAMFTDYVSKNSEWFKAEEGENLIVITGNFEEVERFDEQAKKNKLKIVLPIAYKEKALKWEFSKTPLKDKDGKWNGTIYAQFAKLEQEASGDLIGKTIKVIRVGNGLLSKYILQKAW